MKTCDSKEMVALLWVLGTSPQSLRANFMASMVKERVSPQPHGTYRPGDQKVQGCGGCYCHCHQRKRKEGEGDRVAGAVGGIRVMEAAVTLRLRSGRNQVPPGSERGQEPRGSEAESPALGQPLRWVGSAPRSFHFVPVAPIQWSQFPTCPGNAPLPRASGPNLMSLMSLRPRTGDQKHRAQKPAVETACPALKTLWTGWAASSGL